ncbi:hypothetical protein [Hymenobacter fastidiosus]
MNTTICLVANTIHYPTGGGHLWAYLNWALGFRSIGCRVIWLEQVKSDMSAPELYIHVAILKSRLVPYGLANEVALCSSTGDALPPEKLGSCLDVESAAAATDLLLNQKYALPTTIVNRFKRTALLDIDPGLTQVWLTSGIIRIAPHDVYFTIGETVGQPGARFSDAGRNWHYTPPCVFLEAWPVSPTPAPAVFTTVSHWNMELWETDQDGLYQNDKRNGFLPFLELPLHTAVKLELAIFLGKDDQQDRQMLEGYGWRVQDSQNIAATPTKYQYYIQKSSGEFSCVKPSCIRQQNAWISDRTLCYLASGKPVVVQHTGPSRFLPDAAGLFRFHTMQEAVRSLEHVAADYNKQSALARSLAEEYFDARKVTAALLEKALP